jgi:hypothetical protein
MGLALLPWEKLPAWLLGPLITALGIFLLYQATPYSREQTDAIALILVGTGLSMYGVKKLRRKSPDVASHDENDSGSGQP